LEMFASNFGLDKKCHDNSRSLPQSLKENADTVP
jgi:hypothetical protein